MIGVVEEGAVEELEALLVGVSGLPADAVSVHELVLRPRLADRADLTLQHSIAGSSGRHEDDRWLACQYGLPLRGKSNISLPATVRSVARSECRGDDVPAFWQTLGFTLRYQMLKEGRSYEVHHAGHCIEVTVCRLFKLPPSSSNFGGSGAEPEAGAGQQPVAAPQVPGAQELVSGQLLVEASTTAAEGAHVEAAAALAAFAKLLLPLTSLQPLTVPPRGWLKQQHQQ